MRAIVKSKQSANFLNFILFSFQAFTILFRSIRVIVTHQYLELNLYNAEGNTNRYIKIDNYAANTIITNHNIPKQSKFGFIRSIGRSKITNEPHICRTINTIAFVSLPIFLLSARWHRIVDHGKKINWFILSLDIFLIRMWFFVCLLQKHFFIFIFFRLYDISNSLWVNCHQWPKIPQITIHLQRQP